MTQITINPAIIGLEQVLIGARKVYIAKKVAEVKSAILLEMDGLRLANLNIISQS